MIQLIGQHGVVQRSPAQEYNQAQIRLWLSGTVYKGQQRLNAVELELELAAALQQQQLNQFCRSLNGFFSVVWRQPSGWLLISDKVRSRPLFWRAVNTAASIGADAEQPLIISDSVYQWPDTILSKDELSVEEFLHTGYVTGSATLFRGIAQVQSAQIVQLDAQGQVSCIQNYDHFFAVSTPVDTTAQSEAFWLQQLDHQMTAVTARLISYASGRQIVLPLSGGYDSRILAVYLKRAGYNNLCCFTFGRNGSKEVEISQRVAKALGISWYKVVYSRAMWQQLSVQPEFESYLQFMHGAVSVPNLQVYPALKQLIEQGVIQPDAVMVPGHTGDFISGGHLPSGVLQDQTQLFNHIVTRHYELSKAPLSEELQNKLQLQLEQMIQSAEAVGADLFAVAECWNWKERQAKFIVNSNRYYEFFKLDWWMPLWDCELTNWYQTVPRPLRKGKKLWIRFVNQQMQHTSGYAITGNADSVGTAWKKKLRSYFNYFCDTNAMAVLMPFSRWLAYRCKLSKKLPVLFSFLAEQRIEKMNRQYNGINEK